MVEVDFKQISNYVTKYETILVNPLEYRNWWNNFNILFVYA